MQDPTKYPRVLYKDAEASLPKSTANGDLAKPELEKRGVLVVLDDDPTGTQTVHDVTVLTTFEKEVLVEQFGTKEAGFFILTNTRAYHYNEVSWSLNWMSLYSMVDNVILMFGGFSRQNNSSRLSSKTSVQPQQKRKPRSK